jgi:hypothetical protein
LEDGAVCGIFPGFEGERIPARLHPFEWSIIFTPKWRLRTVSTRKRVPIEAIIYERDRSSMLSSWTDSVAVAQRKDGTFRVRWIKHSPDIEDGTVEMMKFDGIKTESGL